MKPAYQMEKSERFQSVLVLSSTRKKVPLGLGDPPSLPLCRGRENTETRDLSFFSSI